MKQKIFYSIILFCFLIPQANSRNTNSGFRVVGYFSLRSAMGDFSAIPLKRLTHINLFFLNPDSLGNFTRDYSALAQFITAAHKKDVKVLVSIGGGSAHPFWRVMLTDQNHY